MPTRIRLRLTYANVMATIAVFIALGGASYAALKPPKNSVGSKQLKEGAVTTPKIKAEAVTGEKIKAEAVTGEKVKLSTLGKVPSAVSADRALTASEAGRAGNAALAYRSTFAEYANSASWANRAGQAQPVAFAQVGANGKLAEELNIGAAAHTSEGVYCFGNLPFPVRGGQATPDASGTGFTARFGLGEGCGFAFGGEAFVEIVDDEGKPENAPFFVVFYGGYG